MMDLNEPCCHCDHPAWHHVRVVPEDMTKEDMEGWLFPCHNVDGCSCESFARHVAWEAR